ncbi:hypothetical protein AVEN_169748-1 [Araneus ventricosus]|uniref:Uncharacterized protein n=1 Tax=Araneus ventricosus TaxID=182803 RepID=A0A4Y2MZJ3_ARAVE|nr:hypothetical protein AVEN_169748-1 [Araneus ventricosus]
MIIHASRGATIVYHTSEDRDHSISPPKVAIVSECDIYTPPEVGYTPRSRTMVITPPEGRSHVYHARRGRDHGYHRRGRDHGCHTSRRGATMVIHTRGIRDHGYHLQRVATMVITHLRGVATMIITTSRDGVFLRVDHELSHQVRILSPEEFAASIYHTSRESRP